MNTYSSKLKATYSSRNFLSARQVPTSSDSISNTLLANSSQTHDLALESNMLTKVREHFLGNQIASAESEADRIASSVKGATNVKEVKSKLGAKMGADFSGIHIHEGSEASHLSEAIGARAFTVGNDIYLGNNGFDSHVVAHELVHTAQQGMVDSAMPVTEVAENTVQMIPIISSLIRSHHRALDELNDHYDDYKKLSTWERFKWSVKNPLARIRHHLPNVRIRGLTLNQLFGVDGGKSGTRARNERKHTADELVEQTFGANLQDATLKSKDVNGNAVSAFHNYQNEIDYDKHPAGAEGNTRETNTFSTTANDVGTYLGLGSLVGGGLAPNVTEVARNASNPNASLDPLKKLLKLSAASKPSTLQKISGVAGATLGTASSAIQLASNISAAHQARKDGNTAGTWQKSLDAIGNIGEMGAGILTGIGQFAPAIGADAIPGLNIATGSVKAISSTIKAFSSGSRQKDLEALSKKHFGKGNTTNGNLSSVLSNDEIKQMLGMSSRINKLNKDKGIISGVAGGLKATGGALALSGVGTLVGASVGGLGAGLDFIGGKVVDYYKKEARTDMVNEELGLDAKIKLIMEANKAKGAQGNPNLTERDVKHAILRRMGFKSGKRKEAFQQITLSRATKLHQAASNGEAWAIDMLRAMGLKNTGKDLSIQAIVEQLGFDEGKDYREQINETITSRESSFLSDEEKAKKYVFK